MTSRRSHRELQCEEAREGISALLDHTASDSETAALDAHVEHCANCAAYQHDAQALNDRLRVELSGPCDFDRVWDSIEQQIKADNSEALPRVAPAAQSEPAGGGIRRWAGMAIAAMLLIGVLAAGTVVLRTNGSDLPIVTETVRDFETFRIRGGLLDVAANEPAHVRQWVATRVDFNLPGDVDPPAGFKIAGGRLCSFLNRRLAFLHYKKGAGTLSLYVMKSVGLKVPANGAFRAVNSTDGLTTVTWQQKDLAFVVVSNLPSDEVTAFAASFQGRALGPPSNST